jgi:hypothetical protein
MERRRLEDVQADLKMLKEGLADVRARDRASCVAAVDELVRA